MMQLVVRLLPGREIAFVADPLDALVLQIQGSGRLRLQGSDGRMQTVRLAFAGHNDQPYVSVGRWLIEQGQLKAGEASWPGIKDWARKNPQRVTEMDALIAYLQMLGAGVDFDTYQADAPENTR